MSFSRRLPPWFVEFLVRGAQKQLRTVKKMDRMIKQLGIPTLPPPKTQREMMLRAAMLWAVLGAVFVAMYWTLK